MLIARQAVASFLDREFDSHLWMKQLTEQQLHRELCSMRVQPYFKTKPWKHQLVCFLIGLTYPRFLFLLDMGLGKSKLIMDLITQRQREGKLRGALITVPRVINMDSWSDDLLLHSDLEPWPVNVEDIEAKWELLSNPRGDVTMIDYQGLHWALCKRKGGRGKGSRTLVVDEGRVARVQKLYNFIGIDESHKLSNHQSIWFMLMRRLTQTAEYTYAMTGTLFGREVEDIWPQFFLVDRGETFGENMGLFRSSFFDAKPKQWGRGENYIYRPSMDRTLNKMLQHRSLRYDEHEVHDLPERVQRVEQFEMSVEQREYYMMALEGFINAQGNHEEMDGQWTRMRQIASGFYAWKDESGSHVHRFKRNPKLEGTERMLDEIGTRSKVVIVHHYTETGRLICDRLKALGIGFEWFYGGTKDKSASRRRFMEDSSCRVFVMNAEAGGTGNDGLQKVARYMFLYETPTSPTTRQQTIKRIHRPGQQMRTFIYDMVMRQSLDAGILNDIKEMRDTYDSVVKGTRRPGKGFFLQEWHNGSGHVI